MADLESRLQAELEARLGGEGAAGAMADLRRLDAALAAASDADELRQRAALVGGLQAQVRGGRAVHLGARSWPVTVPLHAAAIHL